MVITPMGCGKRTAVLSLLALTACSSTPPTDFYVLTSLADTTPQAIEASARAEVGPLVGVGPVELPSYLDQPAIVTRASANVLTLAEFDQWAQPLQDGITRILAEDLSQLLPVERIAVFPWKRADPVDIQVIVRVARFEVVSGQARLAAEWGLVSGDEGEVVSRRSSIAEPVSGAGYASRVAAMSRALARLSKEIAAAIAETADG